MSALVNHFAAQAAMSGLHLPRSGQGLVALPGSVALRSSSTYSKIISSGVARRARADALVARRDAMSYGRRVDASPAAVRDRGDVRAQAQGFALEEEWSKFLDNRFAAENGGRRDAAVVRTDGLVPMASQALTYFYSEVYDIQHADLPAWQGDILKIDRTVDPAAERYVWYEKDILGVARASNSYAAEDIPIVAGPSAHPNQGNIVPALVGMELNFMDMRRAALAARNGKPDFDLDRSMSEACMRSLAEFGHFLWLYGDSVLGIDGLHNHPAVQTITLLGGPWSGKTPAQILTDLVTILNTIPNSSQGQLGDMKKIKIFLPPLQYQQAQTQIISAAGNKSVLTYFRESYGLREEQVVSMYELQASNSQVYTGGPQGLSADRALVVYQSGDVRSDPVFVLPQDIEMPAPPRQNGLSETTFYHARYGGMKLPDARRLRYVAGL
jgi:hypothetical protein